MRPPTAPVADELRDQLLDAAEVVLYARGIQAVSMDELREASGLALRRRSTRSTLPKTRSWSRSCVDGTAR
jgi:Mg-chelatase subunit ChlI